MVLDRTGIASVGSQGEKRENGPEPATEEVRCVVNVNVRGLTHTPLLGSFLVLLARAIHASVLRTRSARLDDALLERFPRAEHTHACVVRR